VVSRIQKQPESIADKLFRLYTKALEEGVQILTDGDTETKFATSGTMPGLIYCVSDNGCSCQGFASFRRCKHYALYLQVVGKRPPTDAELIEAEAELDRLRGLRDRNQLKSTADWRNLQRASRTVETMHANMIVCADLPPAA
jgi:hypothetical protein